MLALIPYWHFALVGRKGLRITQCLLVGPNIGLRTNLKDFGRLSDNCLIIVIIIRGASCSAIAATAVGSIKMQISRHNWAINRKLLIAIIDINAVIFISWRNVAGIYRIGDYPAVIVCGALIKDDFISNNDLLLHLLSRIINLIVI